MLCYVMSRYVSQYCAMLCYANAMLYYVMSCHVMLCYAMLCPDMFMLMFALCYVMSYHVMMCYVVLCHGNANGHRSC